jgi:hypothetical protein
MALVTPVLVFRKDDPEQKQGLIVSEHLLPQVVSEDGAQAVHQHPIVGVCWGPGTIPAIEYLSPYELVCVGTGVEIEEDEEFDDIDEAEESEEVAPPVS